jgi:hypothetical protein
MKLVTFAHDGAVRVGVAIGEEIVDLSAAAPDLPREMCAFLAGVPPCARGRYLAAGDVVRIAIAGVGEIENAVIAEPAPGSLDGSADREARRIVHRDGREQQRDGARLPPGAEDEARREQQRVARRARRQAVQGQDRGQEVEEKGGLAEQHDRSGS